MPSDAWRGVLHDHALVKFPYKKAQQMLYTPNTYGLGCVGVVLTWRWQILNTLETWLAQPDAPLDVHVRKHAAAFLRDAGEWDLLRRLLTECTPQQRWAETRFAAEGSYAGYLADLAILWEYAERGDNDLLLVICGVLQSCVVSIHRQMPKDLLISLVESGTSKRRWSIEEVLDYFVVGQDQHNFSLLLALMHSDLVIPWQTVLAIIERYFAGVDQVIFLSAYWSAFPSYIQAKYQQIIIDFMEAHPEIHAPYFGSIDYQVPDFLLQILRTRSYFSVVEKTKQLSATQFDWLKHHKSDDLMSAATGFADQLAGLPYPLRIVHGIRELLEARALSVQISDKTHLEQLALGLIPLVPATVDLHSVVLLLPQQAIMPVFEQRFKSADELTDAELQTFMIVVPEAQRTQILPHILERIQSSNLALTTFASSSRYLAITQQQTLNTTMLNKVRIDKTLIRQLRYLEPIVSSSIKKPTSGQTIEALVAQIPQQESTWDLGRFVSSIAKFASPSEYLVLCKHIDQIEDDARFAIAIASASQYGSALEHRQRYLRFIQSIQRYGYDISSDTISEQQAEAIERKLQTSELEFVTYYGEAAEFLSYVLSVLPDQLFRNMLSQTMILACTNIGQASNLFSACIALLQERQWTPEPNLAVIVQHVAQLHISEAVEALSHMGPWLSARAEAKQYDTWSDIEVLIPQIIAAFSMPREQLV